MSQTQQVEPSNSISSQDPHNEETKKAKSRRPPNTAFRQQRLKAWQPILTPKTVLPLFFAVGIIFAPIGGLLLYASSQVQELSIDYTNCNVAAPLSESLNDTNSLNMKDIDPDRVSATFRSSMTSQPRWTRSTETYRWPSEQEEQADVCLLEFTIPNNINPPVLFYYRLTNFYQNHRRYVKSVDIDQLKGRARSADDLRNTDCSPLDVEFGKPIYPCGLIANSMFNDTFDNLKALNPSTNGDGSESDTYTMTTAGTSWAHEGDLYGKTDYKPDDVVPPPNWRKQYVDGRYGDKGFPDLHTWEQFQVWMRTAGLPTFSKLYQRNDNDVLKQGTYQLKIFYRYPVDKYAGTKSILISTRTIMGGKNPFLGIAYIVVGGICILLGAVFLATHLIKPRKLGDHTYLTWNNDQPSTATTTGRAGGA